jgi:hypothetical protein
VAAVPAVVAALALAGVPVLARAGTVSTRAVLIRVTGREIGRPIPSGFLGLSIEFGSLYPYAGADPRAPNPLFVRLIDQLAPGQRPVLRIGGDSTDRTWWPVRGMARPPWATYTLTRAWATEARALADVTHARLILGINLLANSTTIAAAEASGLVRRIGRRRIAALEIGNEPELYSTQAWYYGGSGQPLTGRPRGYGFGVYVREVERVRSALPPIALAGPATGSLGWLSDLGALFAAEPRLRQVTVHRYPLNRCVAEPRSPLYPSVTHLLSLGASRGLAQGMGRFAALAHRHGATFRVDELNAVTCGGEPGVSNTFAAALWTLDTQFSMAAAGADAVDVHIHPEAPANQLFTFVRPHGRWIGAVRPQYYGLLMFARAAPPGARLLRIAGPPPGRVRAWATLGLDGRIRVVLINNSLWDATTVRVRGPGRSAAGVATLERLLAPSAHATGGVTLAGQSFGSKTVTGTLRGRLRALTVKPARGGYRVRLPAASAAMLTMPAR